MNGWTIAWLLVLLLLLGFLTWLTWRIWGSGNKALRHAVRTMEQEIGAWNRYQVPWVLLVGDNNTDAHRLCSAWQLKAAATKGWYGQWWCNNEGAVLHVPSEIFLADDIRRTPLSVWRRLLAALLKIRGKRPLDAVVWTLSVNTLTSDEETLAQTVILQRKFADLQQRLGLSLPIYLVLTGGDNIIGMNELVQALPARLHEAPLGWSSAHARETPYRSDWVEEAIHSVKRVLGQMVIELAALRGELDEALYRLPRQFSPFLSNLHSFCDPVFRSNALDEAPLLRGLYFTGNPSPLMEASASDRVSSPALFSGQLLRKRIFAEQGLAQPLKRVLHLRERKYRFALVACGAVLTLWMAGMLYVWGKQREQAEIFSSQIALLRSNIDATKSQGGQEKKLLNDFWQMTKKIPAWEFRTLAYPGSGFSDIDERVHKQFHDVLWHTVFLPTQSMLKLRSSELLDIRLEGSDQGNLSTRPDEWPSYREANRLVTGALQLEDAARHYNRLLTRGKGSLEEVAALSEVLYGIPVKVADLPTHTVLNGMIMDFDHEHLTSFDFGSTHTQVSAKFYKLMSKWFDRLYSSARLEQNASKLKEALRSLAQGKHFSAEELETLSQEIDSLQQSLQIINQARSRSSDMEPVPGFNTMVSQARQSALVDSKRVDEALSYGAAVRRRLLDDWTAPANGRQVLIDTRPDGSLTLNADLLMLHKRINSLRSQPFFMRGEAERVPGGWSGHLGDDQLNRALALFRSYQNFARQDTPAATSPYQDGVDGIAQRAVAQSMWNTLHEAGFPRGGRNEQPVQAEQSIDGLAQAFVSLGRSDLALELKARMVSQVVEDLRSNENLLMQQEPYKIREDSFAWWNGQSNAAFSAFNVDSAVELQKYLDAQIRLVAPFAAAVEKQAHWLATQGEFLAPPDRLLAEKWQSTLVELRKYNSDNPVSTPAQLAKLVATINDSDMRTCHDKFAQVILPTSTDLFAHHAVKLFTLAQKQCDALQAQAGDTLYTEISSYFTQHLAGRFPFAASVDATDADPERVGDFIRLMNSSTTSLHKRKNLAQQMFLDQIRAAKPLLAALLDEEGVEVGVTWRTRRQHEIGADQIIDWRLIIQNQANSYPLGNKNNLRWRPGQPVTVELRWASGSQQDPVADTSQSNLYVNNKLAQWHYRDRWALLRWLRQQQSPLLRKDGTGIKEELVLTVPVKQAIGQEEAKVFLQVGLLPAKGKNYLAVGPMPVSAPVD
jgi:type VI secretion system protein ImpL